MEYIERVGGYADAYSEVLTNGGQLYPGNGKDSANVVVRGRTCFTYWQKGSKRHREVIELCKYFNIDSEAKTGGRIARWLIDEVLRLPYRDTFWQKQYRRIAMNGGHWHYCHVSPYQSFYGLEIDIKSAYISSLFAGKSLLYQDGAGWIDDHDSLELLRELIPSLPKWFRLQLLGCLAGWRFSFLCRDKTKPQSSELVKKQISKISYNAAFNATHRAILRNYKIMQKIHEIGGEHIKRMHTDSFFLDVSCPASVEERIFSYLEEKQLKTSIKGCGKAMFFDLNTGFIGRKFVGCKLDSIEIMRQHDIKMRREEQTSEIVDRFGHLLAGSSSTASLLAEKGSISPDYYQTELWDNAA